MLKKSAIATDILNLVYKYRTGQTTKGQRDGKVIWPIFLDLGCGDGFLGRFIYELYPDSKGVFLDISQEMIDKAMEKSLKGSTEFIVQDFGEDNWMSAINSTEKFDLIISGYAIHHIENDRKKRLYIDIYNLLKPDGIFLNLEHVSSPTERIEELFGDLFLDGMSDYQESIGKGTQSTFLLTRL